MAVVLILVVLVVFQRQPKADVAQLTGDSTAVSATENNDLINAVSARSVVAAACAPQDKSDPKSSCQPLQFFKNGIGGYGGSVIPMLQPDIAYDGLGVYIRLQLARGNCIVRHDNPTGNPDPNGDTCTISLDSNRHPTITVGVKFSGSDIPSILMTVKEKNDYNDKIGDIGSATATYVDEEVIDMPTTLGNRNWSMVKSQGDININLGISLDSRINNTPELDNYGNHSWTLDKRQQQSWYTTIRGSVNMDFSYNWDWHFSSDDPYMRHAMKLTRLEFCSKGCQVTVTDDIIFNGDLNEPMLNGRVSFTYKRVEDHTGTGTGDINTGKVYWSSDKQTKMNEDRTVNLKLKDVSNDREAFSYNETYHSDSLNKPFQPSTKSSYKRGRDQSYTHQMSGGPAGAGNGPAPAPVTLVDTVNGNFDHSFTNDNGAIASSGGGTLTIGKVTTDLISDGEGKIDLALDSYAPQKYRNFVNSLTHQTLYRGNTDPKVMATPAVKVLPKNIVAINYKKSGKEGLLEEEFRKTLKTIVSQAQQVGVNATYVEATEKDDFLAQIRNFPDGAWLIIGGHGAALGPWNETGGTVNINSIRAALDNRHISMLVTGSCNSARWSSLADEIIGSVGHGAVTEQESQLNNIVTLGGNSFTFTTGDMTSYITGLLKTGTCNNTSGNDSVLGPSPVPVPTPTPTPTPTPAPTPRPAPKPVPTTPPAPPTKSVIAPTSKPATNIVTNIKNSLTNIINQVTKKSTPTTVK